MFSLLSKTGEASGIQDSNTSYSFLQDLNIDQILDRIIEGWDPQCRSMFESFPASAEDEDYRRAIYSDVKNEEVYSALTEFYYRIIARNTCSERKEKAYELVQKRVWYLREIFTYVSSITTLCDTLQKASLGSAGLKGLCDFLTSTISNEDFQKLNTDVTGLWRELSEFRVILTYDKDQFSLKCGRTEAQFEKFLSECFPGQKNDFGVPFSDEEYFSDLEDSIVKLFMKKNKSFFKRLEEFCKKYPTCVNEDIARIEKEIVYYLAFARFQKMMRSKGYEMCTPHRSSGTLSASGLYDLALALTNMETGKRVVPNELYLSDDESFFVLTGPNQGGKTTYGRSLGQLVFLSKMGFDVPAASAGVPYFTNLWTHFSVEESLESGRGKLMDELERLKPIMHDSREGAFVVINELFTTAANYDAIEMGKRVLQYLIDKKCKGIYVTHLGELTKAAFGIVSLRAMVDDENVQTFIIERNEPAELNGINSQVLKYRLTYEQIKERFS